MDSRTLFVGNGQSGSACVRKTDSQSQGQLWKSRHQGLTVETGRPSLALYHRFGFTGTERGATSCPALLPTSDIGPAMPWQVRRELLPPRGGVPPRGLRGRHRPRKNSVLPVALGRRAIADAAVPAGEAKTAVCSPFVGGRRWSRPPRRHHGSRGLPPHVTIHHWNRRALVAAVGQQRNR